MINLESRATQIDDMLDKMAEQVQLDETRYGRMKSAYEAVKNWIEADDTFFKPYRYDVYPHGSVRILTTVKPIGRDEFDLDVAIHLKADTPHTPQRIYNELKRRLSEHEKYKGMLELKNRCIRLNYAGDFHMDILPGIQESRFDDDKIKIPDHDLGRWVSSSPRGYGKWFIAKAELAKESLLEKALRAEKLPTDDFKKKKPLQRAVQLIKRYRDLYFQNDDTYKTSSIVLTTIAGEFYRGEESIFETIDNIVLTIRSRIYSGTGRLKVLNPVNSAEDFTDKWDDVRYYEAFKKFAMHLYSEWQKLKMEQGVVTEATILNRLFGDDIFKSAQAKQALLLEEIRKNKSLGAVRNTGVLTSSQTSGTSSIKRNTFFGDH